jgi:hypothetical protein
VVRLIHFDAKGDETAHVDDGMILVLYLYHYCIHHFSFYGLSYGPWMILHIEHEEAFLYMRRLGLYSPTSVLDFIQ